MGGMARDPRAWLAGEQGEQGWVYQGRRYLRAYMDVCALRAAMYLAHCDVHSDVHSMCPPHEDDDPLSLSLVSTSGALLRPH